MLMCFRRLLLTYVDRPAAAYNLKLREIQPILQNLHGANSYKAMASSKTLKDFGYGFNSNGQLRKLEEDGKPGKQSFQFNVSDNHQECQKHYEDLGEVITDHIYHLLETEEHLIKLPVPDGASEGQGSFIFVSKGYAERDQLLVLIHGSGVVRAGQWARSLIINDNINSGSQIPYIRKGVAKGYGIVLLNSNDNYAEDGNEIPLSGSPEEHASYVWNKYISPTSASSIAIVAHSYGGVVTLSLANKQKNDFERRVKVVAFTDSVHNFSNFKVTKHLKQISKNWVSSGEPLDTPVKSSEHDVSRVSAGTPKHEMTSASCIESVFRFINDKLAVK